MSLDEFLERIANAKSEASMKSPDEPDTIFIHPDKCREIGLKSGDIIHGLTVECPSWEQLVFLGGISGVDPKSKAMWDPEIAFILKNQIKMAAWEIAKK